MFGFYNNNNNNNLKIKVHFLINENAKLNCEIKKLNRSIKKLKNDYYINNIKMVEAINYNIDVLKKEIRLNNNIDVSKEEINTIKLKNDYYDINNDDYIQI
jgi:hypothetical protein